MANYVFRLPDVGEGIAEAEIVAWHVKVGDTVKEDAPLVEVMTDKATVEIGAPVTGRIVRINGESGQMAKVGSELLVIETTGDTRPPRGEAAAPPPPAPQPRPPNPPQPATIAPQPAAIARPAKALASPAVRARAKQLGIDLATVAGTGEAGRVEHADLDALLAASRLPATEAAARPRPPADDVEEIPVIGIRRQIALAMQESKRHIPHFSYVEEVDVTALEDLRAELNLHHGETRPKLTVLPFIVRAMVLAAAKHPGVNAHYDEQAATIRRHSEVHMGVATQTPRGLLVPVIRDANRLDLWEIAKAITRLTTAARNGKATREELSGSTITVTSLGKLGGIAATPIIKPPEVAIIGVNKIAERPVVHGGQIVIRKMMNLSSSFDHRIVDGFDAAEFIQTLRGYLETPAELFIA